MPYKLASYGLSDVGLIRQNNEDFWTCLADLDFFVLADGLGGHQAGEVAAKEATLFLVSEVKQQFAERGIDLPHRQINPEIVMPLLAKSIEDTNHFIYEFGQSHELLRGMGTTLCCLYFHEDYVIHAHVGDSRIYRLRNGVLEQLTQDHSLLRELIDKGAGSDVQKEEFLYKNIITKAIGSEVLIEPTVNFSLIFPHDIYLICSDGLSDMLSKEEIERYLRAPYTVEEKVRTLIHAAKQKGGYDNITVVLVEVAEESEYEEE